MKNASLRTAYTSQRRGFTGPAVNGKDRPQESSTSIQANQPHEEDMAKKAKKAKKTAKATKKVAKKMKK